MDPCSQIADRRPRLRIPRELDPAPHLRRRRLPAPRAVALRRAGAGKRELGIGRPDRRDLARLLGRAARPVPARAHCGRRWSDARLFALIGTYFLRDPRARGQHATEPPQHYNADQMLAPSDARRRRAPCRAPQSRRLRDLLRRSLAKYSTAVGQRARRRREPASGSRARPRNVPGSFFRKEPEDEARDGERRDGPAGLRPGHDDPAERPPPAALPRPRARGAPGGPRPLGHGARPGAGLTRARLDCAAPGRPVS